MFYADRRVPTVSATRNNNTQHMCVTNTTHNIFHAMHSPNTRQTNSMRIVWYKTVTSSEMDTGHTARMTLKARETYALAPAFTMLTISMIT